MKPGTKKEPRMEVKKIDVDDLTVGHQVNVSIEKQDVICWYSGSGTQFQLSEIKPANPFHIPVPSHSAGELCSGPAKQNAQKTKYKYTIAPEGKKPIDPDVVIER